MTLKKFGGSIDSVHCDSMAGNELKRLTSVDLNEAAYRTIIDACRNDRLIYGVDAGAKFLMTDPNCVSACLLPLDGYADITTQIYYKLLEAFCNENDVPLIQVDNGSKLLQLINEHTIDEKCANDCTVVLIRHPYAMDCNQQIGEYEQEMTRHVSIYQRYFRPIPPVILPDSVD